MAVKEQRQLSLFGTKISFSTSPEEEDRAELAKSSEDVEFSSRSASTSGSDDEKPGALPVSNNHNHNHSEDDDHHGSTEVLPMTNGIGERRSGRGTLKRPDKPVPCPRCNSLDTKFCYFNNYNVNQPRHFCKNCQRYWTAGGTLRNVPVGAGRRKNKNSRNSGGGGGGENPIAAAVAGVGEGAGHHHLLDSDKKLTRSSSRGPGTRKTAEASLVTPSPSLCSKEAGRSVSGTSEASSNDSRDDSTCGSSVSNPASRQSQERDGSNAQQFAWPPGAMMTAAAGGVNGCNSTTNAAGGFWHGFVWPAHPVWCPAGWNAAWNSQWGNLAVTAASAAAKAIAENVGSLQSALGKHLREEAENRGPLWAPKTLRIDAQGGGKGCRSGSSFLADIGAGNKVETISTGGMFKAFQQQESSAPAAAAAANKSSEEGDDGGDGGPSEQELDNKEEFEEGEGEEK